MIVSVVIPTRNCAPHIVDCLSQVHQQTYPHDLIEIIVADGSSEDGTPDLAERFNVGRIRTKVLRVTSAGRSAGLNAAIRVSTGIFICRLDVRTRIEPTYISQCVALHSSVVAANVGGVMIPVGASIEQKAIGWAMSHPFGAGNAQYRIAKKSGFVDTIYPGFFRKSIFDEIGLFDDSNKIISEDSDLNERLRAKGKAIYLDINIRVGYKPRAKIFEHGRLYYRYGVARAGNMRIRKSLTSWRQAVAPSFLAFLFISGFLSLVVPEILCLTVTGLTVYLIFTFFISANIAYKNGNLSVFRFLIIVFPVMHFSWGAGFWRGLLLPYSSDDILRV